MSEIQKCPNLVRGGGGQHFSKMSEIQKCPKGRRGGRGQPLLGHCPKFSRFSIWMPPLSLKLKNNKSKMADSNMVVVEKEASDDSIDEKPIEVLKYEIENLKVALMSANDALTVERRQKLADRKI